MFDKTCTQHIKELTKLFPLPEPKTALAFTTWVSFFAYTLHL